jgi:hypothetical protein
MDSFDTDKDGKISHAEFRAGFAKWFADGILMGCGKLSDEQYGAGSIMTLLLSVAALLMARTWALRKVDLPRSADPVMLELASLSH